MSAREGAPDSPAVPNPATANLADQDQTPEQLASAAAERLETIYDAVIVRGNEIGLRLAHSTVGESSKRSQDDETPAFYVDGIGIFTESNWGYSEDASITAVRALRPGTVPLPYKLQHDVATRAVWGDLDKGDASLDFGGDGYARPNEGRAGRAKLTRFARVVTRDENGNPLYEDVAFQTHHHYRGEEPKVEFRVRRNRLQKGDDNPEHSSGVAYPDVEAFTRITNEAADIVLSAAKARAGQRLEDVRPIVEACEALETLQ